MTSQLYVLDVHHTRNYKFPRYEKGSAFKVTSEAYNTRYLQVILYMQCLETIKPNDYVELAGGYYLVKNIKRIRTYDDFEDEVYNVYDLILEVVNQEIINKLFKGKL